MNVQSKQRSWSTANISIWWVCTSHTRNMRITTSRRCTKPSRNTWLTTKSAFLSLEETSMQSWDLEKERNVKVLASTPSTKATREETGWKAGWCWMITPRLTRCSKKRHKNRRPSSLQKGKRSKSTTSWPRGDTWATWKTLKRTTWSTWEVTIDVLWLPSWLARQKRTSITGEKTKSEGRLSISNKQKKTKTSILKTTSSRKDIRILSSR